jgi:hypothetical protein
MGYASLETIDVDMNVLRHKMLKRAGWYIPIPHDKYATEITENINLLKGLCASWLYENFHFDGKINSVEILEQEEIDRSLCIIGIRFGFSKGEDFEGESVAFIDEEEIKGIL